MAYKADEQKAHFFWLELMTFYTADDILVEDETAKDKRSMQDNVGWGLRGVTPTVRDKHLTRGGRVSSCCLLSSRRFEAWRHTDNTFKRDSWQLAMDDMLLTPQQDGQILASKFKCLIMDNASIHKDDLYLLKLELHIHVMFIPPYCYYLSPLDNGGFGLATRFLISNNETYAQLPMHAGLDAAFTSVHGAAARSCFHNCNYHF